MFGVAEITAERAAAPFQRTTSPSFNIGAIRVELCATRRVFLWLALRGAPPGNLARPDISTFRSSLRPLLVGSY